jgi:hypothetical protein
LETEKRDEDVRFGIELLMSAGKDGFLRWEGVA